MSTFLRIIKLTFPYKSTVCTAFLSSVLYGLFNAVSLWVVGSLIGTIMGVKENNLSELNESVSIHHKIDYYFDQLINSSNEIEKLKLVCFFLFISFFFKNIFYYINWVCISFVELKIIKNIRNSLYEKIQNLPLSFFDKKRSGELLSITLNDVNAITVAFNKTFQVFFHEFVSMAILFILLFLISPLLTGIVFLTIPLSAYIIIKIGQSIRRKAMRASFKIADISSIISEKIQGIKIVKAFNMTKKEIELFYTKNLNFFKLQFRQRKLIGLATPINDIIGVSLACILLWYGGQQVLISNHISSEDFLRFILFIFALLQPARKLGTSLASIQSGIVGADRTFSILDLKIKEKNSKNLHSIESFENCIEFKNVSFQYDLKGDKILENINIKINKGQKIALVGSSGSGKTTFANLLLDFYHPTSGEIFIDKEQYRKISTYSLREIIGLVPQEPILFNDTVKNNISYGREDINENFIWEAAKNANIFEYINSMSSKLNSMIGERGLNLSGGQKQRIAIARAILRDPKILVLDEATSSLDSESELKVQKAIDNLIKERTVIIIAHRLSTILNADNILVFDKGKVVESGTHEKLYKLNGVYTKLYNLQYKGINE